jgi:hypothetical protein
MEVKPVEKNAPPSYPAAGLDEEQALLSAHVPERWRKTKRLAGAVAVALAANLSGGCGSHAIGDAAPKPERFEWEAVPQENSNPMLADASDWVRSIYGKPQSQSFIMGAIRLSPPMTEGGVGANPPSSP